MASELLRCRNCSIWPPSSLHLEKAMYDKHDCTISLCHERAWDALLQQFPNRTVFHSLAWLRVLSEVHHLRMILARADVNGRCVAIWPCMALHKGPFRILRSPLPGWSTAYLGPLLVRDGDATTIMQAFFDDPVLHRWSYFRCRV